MSQLLENILHFASASKNNQGQQRAGPTRNAIPDLLRLPGTLHPARGEAGRLEFLLTQCILYDRLQTADTSRYSPTSHTSRTLGYRAGLVHAPNSLPAGAVHGLPVRLSVQGDDAEWREEFRLGLRVLHLSAHV